MCTEYSKFRVKHESTCNDHDAVGFMLLIHDQKIIYASSPDKVSWEKITSLFYLTQYVCNHIKKPFSHDLSIIGAWTAHMYGLPSFLQPS